VEYLVREVPKNFNIFLIGDVHIGTLLHYNSGFAKCLEMLGRPYQGAGHNVAIGMGDYLEAIDHTDKRFDLDTVDKKAIRPDEQREYFEDKIKPHAKKFATLLYGNHEDTLLKYHDYVRSICKSLTIPYGTYTAVVAFHHDGKEIKGYFTHGRGNISSISPDPVRKLAQLKFTLKRKLQEMAGNCIISAMGHTHKLLVVEPEPTLVVSHEADDMHQRYITALQDDDYIPPDHRYFINTGSFLRTFRRGVSGYAEKAMYPPSVLGFPIVRIRDFRVVGVDPIYV
jgi:hypothetical protein